MFKSKEDFDLGHLISSLKVGDVIYSTIRKDENILMAGLVLLRLGDGGELYLSSPHFDNLGSRANPLNPYRWDEERETLLDCDGDVPYWYEGEISIERGIGAKFVDEYNEIPRSLGKFVIPTEEQIKSFLDSDLEKKIRGIIENLEVNNRFELLSLIFKTIGIENLSDEQLIALDYTLFLFNQNIRREKDGVTIVARHFASEEDIRKNQTKH